MTWARVLPPGTAASAAVIAREIGERLREPQRAAALAEVAARQTAFPVSMRWLPHDLAQGDAGLAVLYGGLDACFPSGGWDATAHTYLVSAARGAEALGHLPPGMFSGLGGVAFAAWSLSWDGERYQRLTAELDRHLVPETTRRARSLHGAHGLPSGVFDVISGLSGTGAYLLCRKENPVALDALRGVLAALVAMCEEHDGLPHWHTPHDDMGTGTPMARQFPNGNLNVGLAHGIPGPLALLALALTAGVAVDGQHDTIRRAAHWLADQRTDDRWGVNWPSALALPGPGSPPPAPTRSAWCYGSPGIARALWLAGVALADDKLRELAVEAMAATYRRPREQRAIDSPTFCHGVAGLLQITLRFANDTGDRLFTGAAIELTEQLLNLYAPEHPLGYYSLEPGGNRVDQPGLLDGAPGVALALLAAATDVPPAWDRLFLLS